MQTTAAIATGPGRPFEITEVDVDDPRPGEVQVRMVACGVCHTDAIVRDQWYPTPLPAVLGHEGAGVVEAVGWGSTTSPSATTCCSASRAAARAGTARRGARRTASTSSPGTSAGDARTGRPRSPAARSRSPHTSSGSRRSRR